jgi:phosphatidylglycerol lysyltransferase
VVLRAHAPTAWHGRSSAPRPSPVVPLERPPPLDHAEFVARFGGSSVSVFTLGPDLEILELAGPGLAGYAPWRRWAVLAGDAVAVGGQEEVALDDLLDQLRHRRLRPLLAAVTDPAPYRARRMHAHPVAKDPIINLATFRLAGKRMASVRHSVTSAERAGLAVVPWSPEHAEGCEAVSRAWLQTKRGGELGFTLHPFTPEEMARTDARLALDRAGQVVGFVTWHRFQAGRCRVLDLMRRLPAAPNPTMDLLVARSLLEFAAAGVERASLGCVPDSMGGLAERVYPTRGLARFKDKYAPVWEDRWLVVPRRRHVPGALLALARTYVSGGLLQGLRRNG